MNKENRTILTAIGGAAILCIGLGWVSVYSASRAEAAKATKESEAEARRKERREADQAAFKALTPARHIEEAGKAIEAANLPLAHQHMSVVPKGTPGLGSVQQRLAALEAKEKAAKEKAAKEAKAIKDQADLTARKLFAGKLEQEYLDRGLNVDVTALGGKAETLRIKYALTSKVLAHQISKGELIPTCRAMGFKRVILTDGFDSSIHEGYTWDLTK